MPQTKARRELVRTLIRSYKNEQTFGAIIKELERIANSNPTNQEVLAHIKQAIVHTTFAKEALTNDNHR